MIFAHPETPESRQLSQIFVTVVGVLLGEAFELISCHTRWTPCIFVEAMLVLNQGIRTGHITNLLEEIVTPFHPLACLFS